MNLTSSDLIKELIEKLEALARENERLKLENEELKDKKE